MNKTHNIDWLELTFNYNPNFITNLITKELNLIVKTTYKNNKPTYYVNDLFSIFILEPNGAVEGRTYIKITNPKLYQSLTPTIELLKELSYKYGIELLYLNQLDITTDFIGIDLLQQIDLNKLNEYKAASKIYLKAITNEQGGKTLYFNTIDTDKYIGKKQKKQRANGKLYTKSIELEIKKNKYKQSYQNPTNELITRLELSFKKDFIVAKETHLLKAMADFIWTNPQKLISEKDYIIQYIFQEYEHLYYLENNGITILDFNTIFNDHNELYDYGHITDLIDLYKGNTDNYKIKMTKYRKTYNKPIFNKKLYLESIEANILLWQNEYKEFMTGPIIEKLLKNTGTTHHHQLDIVKIKEDKETNGENLHMLIHNHIYSYLERNPITETYEVKSEGIDFIEDLFN